MPAGNEIEVLSNAKLAATATALAIWERDGKVDCGSCGSAMMLLKGNTRFAKAALAGGFAYSMGGDIVVKQSIPDEVQSQNADIAQESLRAFRDVVIAGGFEKAIKRFWTYTD